METDRTTYPPVTVPTDWDSLRLSFHILQTWTDRLRWSDPEVGMWMPGDDSGAQLTFTDTEGHYIKIADHVWICGRLTYPVTVSGTNASIGGLPFRVHETMTGSCALAIDVVGSLSIPATTKNLYAYTAGTRLTNANLSTLTLSFTGTYFLNG